MKITDKYVFFWQGPFSNWYSASFKMDGVSFLTTEQAFMWQKAMFFDDHEIAAKILSSDSPKAAKDLGRQVKNYNDAKWNEVRSQMMLHACNAKFAQNEEPRKLLLETGERILVEASPYDKIWGIGMGENEDGVENEANWKGLNLLGKVLMQVREKILDFNRTP